MILNPCSKETVLFLKLPGYLVLYSILLLLYTCLLRQRQPELLGTRLLSSAVVRGYYRLGHMKMELKQKLWKTLSLSH